MAKRNAESQLTRDSRSDDDDDDNNEQTGFKRADDKTLSGRVIRGMPKRGGGTPSASPATATNGTVPDTPTPAPRFAGFGTLPSASPAASAQAASGFSFTPKPFPEATPSAFSATKEPSATSKMFASFLGSNPTPPASPTTSGDDGLFKYYTKLRGLNISLEDACKKALQADPFADLSPIFKHYTEHRASIERPRSADPVSTNTSNGASTPVPVPQLKPPSVPTSFAFSPFPAASSSSQPASSAPVAFPAFAPPTSTIDTASSSTLSTASPLSFSTDSPHSPPKPSKFDSSAPVSNPKSATASHEVEKATKPGFSFGTSPTFGSGDGKATTSLFSPSVSDDKGSKAAFTFGVSSAPTSLADSPSKSSFTFGTSAGFEPGKSLSFGDNAKSGEVKPPSLFSTPPTMFGTSSLFSSPSSISVPPSSDSPPKSTFGTFGTGSAFGATSSAFGGATGGSLGNPVGFSFGSSSSNTSVTPEPPLEEATSHEGTPSGDTAPEGTGLALEPSAYDKEGAGEEEEDTLYEERCKAFKLDKKDGKPEWVDLGIGVFRCKKHKTTGLRRVLMRNSGSGRILLNFGIFASLKPTQQKNVVSFVAMDGSAPASFRLKVKSEAIATQLRDAIVNEVEALTKK